MQTRRVVPLPPRNRAAPLPLRLSRDATARLALVLALGLAVWLASLPLTRTPPVLPATAPATEFSGARAYAHLQVVAAEPHPMGSPEHEQVVRYLVSQLAALGLEPEVQRTVAVKPDFEGAAGQVYAAQVENVVARIPGTASTGAVLLASHYDSMPTSNNAADGGIGVATVLETARALVAGPPLANDVILFFGDGDATPTLGERAFQTHPWFRDVRLGFELEATPEGASALAFAGQGSPDRSGPVSPYLESDNGWYLREALRVVPDPFAMMVLNDYPLHASSLYSLLIDTDVAGVGFVQFLGGEAYHTLLDRPDRVAPGSLQHHGGYLLALARHFGEVPLGEHETAPARVAFNLLPGVVVDYPVTWAAPLAGLLGLVFVTTLVIGFRRGRLTVGGLVAGTGLFVLSLVVTPAATALVWGLASALNPASGVFLTRGTYGLEWRVAALVLLTVAAAAALYLGARRLVPAAGHDLGVAAGALVLPVLLAVGLSLTLPTPSYLVYWPALAGVLLLAWGVLWPGAAARPWPRAAALAVAAAVTLVLAAPPFVALFPTLAVLGRGAAVPPVVAAFGLAAVLLGTLVPLLQVLGGRRRWLVPTVCGVLALALLAGEGVTSGFDAEHPRPNQIQYTLDADTGAATWQSAATAPDGWTEQFFADGYKAAADAFSPGYFFEQAFSVIRAPAPAVDLPAPRLTVLADRFGDGVRTLRLRLESPRGAYAAHVDLALPGDLLAAAVGGQTVEIADGPTRHLYDVPADQRRRFPLLVHNLPKQGLEIVLELRGGGPVPVTLTDYSNGLPDVPGLTVTPRPPEFMPAPYDFRDPTVVRTSFVLAR